MKHRKSIPVIRLIMICILLADCGKMTPKEKGFKNIIEKFILENRNKKTLNPYNFDLTLEFKNKHLLRQNGYFTLGAWVIEVKENNKLIISQSIRYGKYNGEEDSVILIVNILMAKDGNLSIADWDIRELHSESYN